jgi:tetratricopeptide (TPR) repeat protein
VSAHEFYTLRGYHDDWYATHRTALTACRDARNRRGEAALLTILGQPALAASRRTGVSGPEDLRRAADLFAACEDRHGQAIALRTLANNLLRRGQREAALDLFTEALVHYEASGDVVGESQSLRYIGQTHLAMQHHDRALGALERAVTVAAQLTRTRPLAQAWYWIGQTKLARGDLDGARTDFFHVLQVIDDAEHTGRAYAAFGLGEVARKAGDQRAAERHLKDAADVAHDAADGTLEGRAYLSLAEVYREQGQTERLAMTLTRAVAALRGSDATYLCAQALDALGDAYARRGATADARARWAEALQLFTTPAQPEAEAVRRKLAEPP